MLNTKVAPKPCLKYCHFLIIAFTNQNMSRKVFRIVTGLEAKANKEGFEQEL